MTSLLVTVFVAACVTLLVHGFDELRIDDIKLLQSLMSDPKIQVKWTDLKECLVHKIYRLFERNPEGLYPDSPCPHCSALCSIKDEMKECLENTKFNKFMVQVGDSLLSSVCRPDVMQLIAEPKILSTIAETWANCAAKMAFKLIRETPGLEYEEYMCWVIVKSTQCLKNIMKEQMSPLYDVISSIANEIPYSRLCGEYYEKILVTKATTNYDSFSRKRRTPLPTYPPSEERVLGCPATAYGSPPAQKTPSSFHTIHRWPSETTPEDKKTATCI